MQSAIPEFAILGAGAMGSIVAAHLARAGHSVVVLARAQRARDIEQHGLRIRGLIEFTQRVPVISDPAMFRGAAVLILGTKTHGTDAALAPIRGADIGVAFSMQNGMMKNDQLINALGRQRVLGSLADASGEVLPSGEVLFTRNGMLYLGELDGRDSARAHKIASSIAAAGVNTSAVANILTLEWSKFASWVGMMALSVTTRAYSWKFLIDPNTALVVVRLVREIGALAAAHDVQLSDRSTLPVASLCQSSEAQAVARLDELGRHMQHSAPQHRMSTLQDLNAGRTLEVEETLGFALREAQRLKVPTPLLDAMYHLIAGIDQIQRMS
ncbi:MAG TPA: 2-dehydropantoate 2-reductase [Steroidobacteraceae bacterium]|jgi:2-dehydropantoate 2-reductase|nr:2-dehydropantoate 2-reductase [Steroidobacteraceae bacterium]